MKRFSGIRLSGPSVRKRRDGLFLFPLLLPTPLQPIELSGFFFSSARISSTRLSGDFGVLNTVSGLDQVEQVPIHGGPVDFRTGYRIPGMTEKCNIKAGGAAEYMCRIRDGPDRERKLQLDLPFRI